MGHDGDNPSTPHELILTPTGRLLPAVPADGTPVAELAAPLAAAFAESSARGLLRLATEELHARLPPALDHLRPPARPGPRPARAAFPRLAAVRRREESPGHARAARADPAGGGTQRGPQGAGRIGRRVPPAGLVAARGAPLLARHSEVRGQ